MAWALAPCPLWAGTPFMVQRGAPAFPVCRRCGPDLAVPHELSLCRHLRLVGSGHNCPKLSPVVQRARPQVSDIQASGDVGQCCTWQRRPAVALGLNHHSRGAVAVQNGGDDASVQIAEAVVMLGPRHECRCHNPIARVAAELQSLRVAWPAAEAGQARIEPFLDAEAMADPTGSRCGAKVRACGQGPPFPARVQQHGDVAAAYARWRRWQLVIPIVWASGYEPGEGAALGAAPELEIVLAQQPISCCRANSE